MPVAAPFGHVVSVNRLLEAAGVLESGANTERTGDFPTLSIAILVPGPFRAHHSLCLIPHEAQVAPITAMNAKRITTTTARFWYTVKLPA